MSRFNFPAGSSALNLLTAVSAANTAAATGTGVDLQGYEGSLLVIQNHGVSTGTLDGAIQDSADNVSFANVSGLTFTQETTTAGTQKIAFDRNLVRRYIRYVGTVGTGPQVVGVTAVAFAKSV